MNFVDDAGYLCGSETASSDADGRTAALAADDFLWWRLVLHASIFQHVGPLPARSRMTVFQVLPKVVGSEELLGLVTFAELVHVIQVSSAGFPIWRVWELFSAVPTHVSSKRVCR